MDCHPGIARQSTDFYWSDQSAVGLRALLNESSLTGIQWHEADGVVRFSAPGKAQVDAPTIVLSPETGLIESPIVTDEGAEARAFLNPAIVLGCLIDSGVGRPVRAVESCLAPPHGRYVAGRVRDRRGP